MREELEEKLKPLECSRAHVQRQREKYIDVLNKGRSGDEGSWGDGEGSLREDTRVTRGLLVKMERKGEAERSN